METIYEFKVSEIGTLAPALLEEGVFIIFEERSFISFLAFGFIHEKAELKKEVKVGDVLEVNGEQFPITHIGEWVNHNLKETGHTTFELSWAVEENFGNQVICEGKAYPKIKIGDTVRILH